ncbi:MAG: glycosyltransferase [Pseudomonadota bacterium]
MEIMEHVRRNRFYGLWRKVREQQNIGHLCKLLLETGEAVYDKELLDKRLIEIANRRCRIPQNPGIAAFGVKEWEDKGLWQAFGRAGDFSLFDYGEFVGEKKFSVKEGRSAIGKGFLDFIDARASKGRPVHVAFFYVSGASLDPLMLRQLAAKGIWTVLLGLDDKQQMPGHFVGSLQNWQLEAARNIDLYWTTWRTGADWLVSKGVNPWYSAAGADPTLFYPRPMERDIPVLWIGGGYGPRFDFIRWLRGQGFDIRTYGRGWDGGAVSFEKMMELYSRAQVVLGMGGVGQTDAVKHLKGRDFEVPMSGSVYLTSFNPELTDFFNVGKEILCYSSFFECADLLHWLLRRPQKAEQIRYAARARCINEHTWDHRIQEFMALLRVT